MLSFSIYLINIFFKSLSLEHSSRKFITIVKYSSIGESEFIIDESAFSIFKIVMDVK